MPTPDDFFPAWTLAPFAILVLCIAVLPVVLPRAWEHHAFQALVTLLCAAPVVAFCWAHQRFAIIHESVGSYVSFVTILGALYVTSGGIHIQGDIEATPRVNVTFLVVGSILASVVGTTGASMLLIRPLLRTNRQRENRAHLVPFFILAVANAGGLLTPLGDPPLLIGYLEGVPFFWTLRLFPVWALYIGWLAAGLYFVDRRAYAREPAAALTRDRAEVAPLSLLGWRNVLLLLAVVPSALMPAGIREASMVAITALSYWTTARDTHRLNGFTFAPIIDVAIIFAGLFVCLGPVAITLAHAAPTLPLQHGWQLFWGSGLLSAVLDNAPTYSAFAALARGLSVGQGGLVSGIAPLNLAAISAGSVLMGATTYIGNGPNLMVKAIADREKIPTPSFARYALFAFGVMLPAHVVMTLALVLLDR